MGIFWGKYVLEWVGDLDYWLEENERFCLGWGIK